MLNHILINKWDQINWVPKQTFLSENNSIDWVLGSLSSEIRQVYVKHFSFIATVQWNYVVVGIIVFPSNTTKISTIKSKLVIRHNEYIQRTTCRYSSENNTKIRANNYSTLLHRSTTCQLGNKIADRSDHKDSLFYAFFLQ